MKIEMSNSYKSINLCLVFLQITFPQFGLLDGNAISKAKVVNKIFFNLLISMGGFGLGLVMLVCPLQIPKLLTLIGAQPDSKIHTG